MNNKHVLFGWNDSEFKYRSIFEASYDWETKKRISLVIDGDPVGVGLIPRACDAAIAIAQEELDIPRTFSHFAAGTAATSSVYEEIFVEFQEDSSKVLEAVGFNPNTGLIRGTSYDINTTKMCKTYKFKGRKGENVPHGTAVWAAILLHAKSVYPEIASNFEKLKDALLEKTSVEEGFDALGYISWYLYFHLVKDTNRDTVLTLNISDTDTQLKNMTKLAIEGGEIGPSKGKKIFKTPYILYREDVKENSSVVCEKFDKEKYRNWSSWVKKESDFSIEEKSLVPKDDPNDAISPVFVKIMDDIYRTKEYPPSMRLRRILLEGPSGTGKTHMARSIARTLGRPYITYVCGTNDGKEELMGIVLPVVEDNSSFSEEEMKLSQVIKDSTDEDMIDNIADFLGLPNTSVCFFEPKRAYKELTGNVPDESIDESVVYGMLSSRCLKEVKRLSSKTASSKGEVTYRYVPSAISRAITNGWLLEIQEPTLLANQGALSCLYDVLDSDSTGVLNTPTGDLYRHPDFMVVITQNRKYKGCKPLNEAARARMQEFIALETPPREVIMNRISKKCEIDDTELVKKITDVYLKASEAATEDRTDGAISMRQAFMFAKAVKDGVDPSYAFRNYLLNAATTDPEDQENIIFSVEDCELFDGLDLYSL